MKQPTLTNKQAEFVRDLFESIKKSALAGAKKYSRSYRVEMTIYPEDLGLMESVLQTIKDAANDERADSDT